MEAALAPSQPQKPGKVPVDMERAVLTLLVEGHASYRGIQTCLTVLLGLQVSLGTITTIVQAAGEQAQRWLEQQVSEEGRVLALDEQYSSKRGEAYLNVVDAHSGQVWASLPAVAVDGESWTLALWYLREQGVQSQGTVSDGGRAIAEALRTTKALSTHQRDVWHVLHLAGQVQARLERVVQDEEARGQVIERQEQHRATTGKQATGRPAKTTVGEQEQLLSQLHRLQEGVMYLFAQLRGLLEIVVLSQESQPRVLNAAARRGEVETVLDLLEELVQAAPLRAPRGAESEQAGAAGVACSVVLCRGTGSRSAGGQCSVGRRGGGTHRLGVATPSYLGKQPKHLLAGLNPAWREPARTVA